MNSPTPDKTEISEPDQVGEKRRREDEEADKSITRPSKPGNKANSLAFYKTTLTGSRVKAVARPEEPDGVETVCYGDISTTVPTQLFKLDGLRRVLDIKTWNEYLTKGERDFLIQFLPDDCDAEEVIQDLLDKRSNFFFGNPAEQIYELMKEGECHPRVVKYREGLRCLNHSHHFHLVKDYHDRMVSSLQNMARDTAQLPLHQCIKKWKDSLVNTTFFSSR